MKGRLLAFGGRGPESTIRKSMPAGCDSMRGYRFSPISKRQGLRGDQAQPVSDAAMMLHPEVIAIEVKEALTKVGVVSSYDSDDGL